MLFPGVMPAMGIRPAPAYAAVLAAGAAFVSAYAVIKAAAAALARAAACAPCRFVSAVGIGGQRKGRKDSQRKDNGKKLFHNMLPFIIYNAVSIYLLFKKNPFP